MTIMQMRSALAFAGVAALAALSACSDTPSAPPIQVNPATVLGRVQVSPQAALLAAGGTQQLSVTAFGLDGSALASYGTVRYSSIDSSKVAVSATGLMTARTGLRAITDAPVGVVATVVKDGITQADTAWVAVVATAGTGATFSLADPSSATKVAVNDFKSVNPTITYFDGTSTVTMSGSAVPVKIRVTPSTLAKPYSASSFQAVAAAGQVTVYATTSIFGTAITDSVTYTLGDPAYGFIRLYRSGLKLLQGYATGPAAFGPTTTFYVQVGGYMDLQVWADLGSGTAGVTCTATEGGVAPPPVTGLVSNYGEDYMTFTTAGLYSCDWTNDGVSGFPTDGSLHFNVRVR